MGEGGGGLGRWWVREDMCEKFKHEKGKCVLLWPLNL